MTVYMLPEFPNLAPKLQVMRLSEAVSQPEENETGDSAPDTVEGGALALPPEELEVAAHIQLKGDVLGRLGDWIGETGSQCWIEGFAVAPRGDIHPDQIEYQAVLGRGWLSPWAEGGQFCGSRGMALPILGLRVRLRGAALATHAIELSASFTDGTAVGPVGAGEPCEATSLAPLEAFQIVIRKLGDEAEIPNFLDPVDAGDVKKRKRTVKEAAATGSKFFRGRQR
jgi:hypothetical protein